MINKTAISRSLKIILGLLSIFNLSTINGLKAEEILRIGAIPDKNPIVMVTIFEISNFLNTLTINN